MEEIRSEIRKFVLQNAVRYNGKANPKAIVGKIMGQYKQLRENPKTAMKEISDIVEEVNNLSLEDQKSELENTAPEMLEKKETKRRDIFDALKIMEGEKVRTAFPPGPEKYPHIGHAKACIFNYLIAQKYKGEFFLRFEDTNPNLVKAEFYDIMIENFKWLGVKWDKLIYASDHMELFYEKAEDIIKSGDAYICSCDSDAIKLSRAKGIACSCRSNDPGKNLELWKKFSEKKEKAGILRLKIDLKHKNSTMRDPTLFRIIDTPHARHGNKYRVWPNYDFQNAIMDGYYQITHRVRSKEFEMRSELQNYIQKLLGYPETKTFEFARFNLKGVLSSGRVIREKIDNKELLGWDDPSLTTIVALRRRGFVPEAIKEFLLKTGMTKSEATLTWDDLIMHNKRILDDEANRFFFIEDPVEIKIIGAPEKKIEIKNHPDHPERGSREFNVNESFFISKKDIESIKEGELYRLMECLNFKKEGDKFVYTSDDLEEYKKKGKGIFHFLPISTDKDDVEVMMPDHSIKKGYSEKIDRIKEGEVVQFERFGFVRLDSKKEKKFWFTH